MLDKLNSKSCTQVQLSMLARKGKFTWISTLDSFTLNFVLNYHLNSHGSGTFFWVIFLEIIEIKKKGNKYNFSSIS